MATVTLGHHYLGGQGIREVSSSISCIAGILFLSHISSADLKECVQLRRMKLVSASNDSYG